jgi:hypothetical protein
LSDEASPFKTRCGYLWKIGEREREIRTRGVTCFDIAVIYLVKETFTVVGPRDGGELCETDLFR